jgi:hypothetical protein
MSETLTATDEALKAVQLEIAKADLRLKELEIRYRPGPWKALFTNPILIGAFATAYVAFASAFFSFVNSRAQRELDLATRESAERLEEFKLESSLILEMVKTTDPDRAATNLKFLLDLGLIRNPEAVARLRAFLLNRSPGEGPPLPTKR